MSLSPWLADAARSLSWDLAGLCSVPSLDKWLCVPSQLPVLTADPTPESGGFQTVQGGRSLEGGVGPLASVSPGATLLLSVYRPPLPVHFALCRKFLSQAPRSLPSPDTTIARTVHPHAHRCPHSSWGLRADCNSETEGEEKLPPSWEGFQSPR